MMLGRAALTSGVGAAAATTPIASVARARHASISVCRARRHNHAAGLVAVFLMQVAPRHERRSLGSNLLICQTQECGSLRPG